MSAISFDITTERLFVGVDQKPNGCWMACLSSLTGIPLDLFPDTSDAGSLESRSAEIRNAARVLLRDHGFMVLPVWAGAPAGWSIAGGTSPRGSLHAVLAYDGRLAFDPHPSRAGLDESAVVDYEIVVPMVGHNLPTPPRAPQDGTKP